MMNMTGTETSNKPRHGRRILVMICAAMLGIGAIQSTSWANQSAAGAPPSSVKIEGTGKTEGTGSLARQDRAPSPTMDETYASREAEAKSLESFKGGDIVIIGGTGAVIVLLVILILVLA